MRESESTERLPPREPPLDVPRDPLELPLEPPLELPLEPLNESDESDEPERDELDELDEPDDFEEPMRASSVRDRLLFESPMLPTFPTSSRDGVTDFDGEPFMPSAWLFRFLS